MIEGWSLVSFGASGTIGMITAHSPACSYLSPSGVHAPLCLHRAVLDRLLLRLVGSSPKFECETPRAS